MPLITNSILRAFYFGEEAKRERKEISKTL